MPSGLLTCFFMVTGVTDTFDLPGEPVIMDMLRPAHDCSRRRCTMCTQTATRDSAAISHHQGRDIQIRLYKTLLSSCLAVVLCVQPP